jgi:hypothetical protein
MKTLRKYYFLAVIPSLVLLCGGVLFKEFVLHAIHINPLLNLFIIAVAVFGVCLVFYDIYKANWEYDKLVLFYERNNAGESMEELINDPIFDDTEIAKVLISVANTKGRLTSRIEQETIERSLHELQSHLDARLEFPQYLTGFLIALGLLGTFIGLLETLVSTAGLINSFGQATQGENMDASFAHMVLELNKPLASMGTAFSASMFGLIGSLAMGLTVVSLRGAGKKLVVTARTFISEMVKHVVHEMDGPGASQRQGISESFLTEFLHDLMVLQRESVLTSRNSSEASLQAGMKLEIMNDRLGDIMRQFQSSIEESKAMRQLVSFGPRMHEVGQQTLEEIRNLGQMINQKLASTDDITRNLNVLSERLNINGDVALRSFDMLPQIVGTMQSGQTSLANALSSLQNQQAEMAGMYERSVQHIAQMPGLLSQIATRMTDELTAIQHQAEIHSSVATRLGQLGTVIGENSSNITRDALSARQLQIDLAKHMSVQNERVKSLEAIPQALSSISEALTRQNVLSQSIVEEMRNGRQTMIRDLRLELREAIRELSTRSDKA